MTQKTISFLIKPHHLDYKVAKKQAIQVRRLYNGLNSIARVVHAKNKTKYTTVEEQPVDERLVDVFNAQNWVKKNPYLGNRLVFETLRKNIERVQKIILPQKVAQQTGRELAEAWSSFYALRKKGLFSNPPSYRRMFGTVRYTKQALSVRKSGWVKPTGWETGIKLPSHITNIQAARLTHSHAGIFKLELIYVDEKQYPQASGTETASIDFGLNNLITLVTTKLGERPKIVTGRELKSINRFYNKRSSQLKQKLARGGVRTSKEYQSLWGKRNRKVNHILHSVSSQVISYLISTGVNTLIIGWNTGFKDKINIGRKNNQQFTQIPHARLRDMLTYKANQAGIQVIIQEESYTSKASFIDNDKIPVYEQGIKHKFSGQRTTRGTYYSHNKILIHADVNGAWNIMRKSNPTICWFSGIIVMPERLAIKC